MDLHVEISIERMKKISDAMTDKVVCLLCSPPGSRKTAFAKAFKEWLSEQNRTVIYISLSTLKCEEGGNGLVNANTFDNYWITTIGKTWESCINETDPMDILIDDVHVIGNNMSFFWDNLKRLNERTNKRVLLLSRENTQHMKLASSFGIQKHFGLEHLHLTELEFYFLSHICSDKNPGLSNKLDNPPFLYECTRGHVGLLSSSFQYLLDRCYKDNFASENLFLVLISKDYKEYIRNTMPYNMIRDWSLTSQVIKFLLEVLVNLDDRSRFSLDSIKVDNKEIIVNKFLDDGIITKIDEELELVTPMMGQILWDLVNTSSKMTR